MQCRMLKCPGETVTHPRSLKVKGRNKGMDRFKAIPLKNEDGQEGPQDCGEEML